MSIQLQSTSSVLSVSLEKTEPIPLIKNEPPESEIGTDNNMINSLDEGMISDLKDMNILSHVLENLKSENDSENILEGNYSESVETVFVKIENTPFIKMEDIGQSEILNKTENTSDENVGIDTGHGVIEVQGLNEHFNVLDNLKTELFNFPKDLSDDFSECYKTVGTASCENDQTKRKAIEVPVIPCCCEKCTFLNGKYSYFKQHELSHKTEAEMDNQHLNETFRLNLKEHKLIHLKQKEFHYFYCHHCSYKCKQKAHLKTHMFSHFKNEEIPFHCYICDFVTLKRDLIIEHFKKHPKHHSKWNEREYKNQLKTYTKKRIRYCCKRCAFRTYQYAKLKLHELSHTTESEMDDRHLKYCCDKCKYKTFRHYDLKRHKLTHLKSEKIQYFYCYHCSYKGKQKTNLKTHIFSHFNNENVPFHCYICDFMTLKREAIMEHIKMHSKIKVETHTEKLEKRCFCTRCTFVTRNSGKFKLNKLSHKTNEPMDNHYVRFHCDKCDYKTCVRYNLQTHKLIHLKPEEIHYFYCYHCSYKSKRKNNLKKHIFTHFKKEQVKLECYICNFVTLNRTSIIEHIKKHSKVPIKSENS